jgi:hypothetical protein
LSAPGLVIVDGAVDEGDLLAAPSLDAGEVGALDEDRVRLRVAGRRFTAGRGFPALVSLVFGTAGPYAAKHARRPDAPISLQISPVQQL